MPESFEEAFPEGVEECVRTLGSHEGVDDPAALCSWLQEHGFEAIQDASPEKVLADLSVEYVSVVDTPAQRSQWLLAKSEEAPEDLDAFEEWSAPYLIRKLADPAEGEVETAERKVWGAVLVPGESDKQDDLVPEHEIEAAAHAYLRDYRKVDEDHTLRDGAGVPIESYIVRGGPETFETPSGETVEYPAGTWIMGVQVGPEEWQKVLDGDLNGFSIYGGANAVPATDLLTAKQREVLLSMTDDEPTEKSVDAADAAVVLSVLDSYKSAGATPEESSVKALAEWVKTDAPDDAVEGSTIVEADESDDSDSDSDSDSDDEDEDDEDAEDGDADTEKNDSPMGDTPDDDTDDETNDLLKEVRDTVQDTKKSVESHGERLDNMDDRLTALEKGEDDGETEDGETEDGETEDAPTTEEVEEAAAAAAEKAATEAVEKSFRDLLGVEDDEEDLGEVVRKYELADPETEEEGDGLNLSLDGITETEA